MTTLSNVWGIPRPTISSASNNVVVAIAASTWSDAAQRFHILETDDAWNYRWEPVTQFPYPLGSAAQGRIEMYGPQGVVGNYFNQPGVDAPGATRLMANTLRFRIPLGMGPGPWNVTISVGNAVKEAVPYVYNCAMLTGYIP